jgi:hypothetical protein
MVFFVEMSCLIGKLRTNKNDCRQTNLCHGHSKPIGTANENPKAHMAHDDDDARGSHHDHANHGHGHALHEHEQPVSNATHEGEPPSDQAQHHHSDLVAGLQQFDTGENESIVADDGITKLESCCIDDSMRFFSTPTYFQTYEVINLPQVPLIVFCNLHKVGLISLEEKAISFKPPENEALPPFSRIERFQVFLI